MQAAELETTCMIYHELINASSINTPGILNVMENVHFKYLPWIIHSHNSNSKNVDFHDNTPLTAKPIKNISINFNITFYWFVLFINTIQNVCSSHHPTIGCQTQYCRTTLHQFIATFGDNYYLHKIGYSCCCWTIQYWGKQSWLLHHLNIKSIKIIFHLKASLVRLMCQIQNNAYLKDVDTLYHSLFHEFFMNKRLMSL